MFNLEPQIFLMMTRTITILRSSFHTIYKPPWTFPMDVPEVLNNVLNFVAWDAFQKLFKGVLRWVFCHRQPSLHHFQSQYQTKYHCTGHDCMITSTSYIVFITIIPHSWFFGICYVPQKFHGQTHYIRSKKLSHRLYFHRQTHNIRSIELGHQLYF